MGGRSTVEGEGARKSPLDGLKQIQLPPTVFFRSHFSKGALAHLKGPKPRGEKNQKPHGRGSLKLGFQGSSPRHQLTGREGPAQAVNESRDGSVEQTKTLGKLLSHSQPPFFHLENEHWGILGINWEEANPAQANSH